MGIVLVILANIAFPIGILIGFAYSLRYILTKRFWRLLDRKLKKSAVLWSHLQNVWGQEFGNDLLIKKYGYQFGDEDDSTSDVTGRNLRDKTLTPFGIGFAKALNVLGKDHAIEAIDED